MLHEMHPSARIENLSMVGNFTIAFWFRTSNVDNTNTFFRFEKTNVTATERVEVQKTEVCI